MKKTAQRLPGARVDTSVPLTFSFDGKRYVGYKGDSLASALLANGVRIVGRSFKLHRPRGVFGAGKEEPNALVQLETGPHTEPNMRATLIPLYQGLRCSGQNAWPSVKFDAYALMGLFKRVLPAAFYYKTFMWPSWHNWAWLLRRVAGLGCAPQSVDPDTYLKQNRHTDVLVVGAGRSGLMAALDASADATCDVLLFDEQEAIGGRLLANIDQRQQAWLANALEELAARDNVTVLLRTTVIGYYDGNVLAALERLTNHLGPSGNDSGPRERLWRIFARRVVLATGAIERPLVFPNNDRPGIMLASAVREYTHRYGLTLGNNIVFYTNNNAAWRDALSLAQVGVRVAAIIDSRSVVEHSLLLQAENAGINGYLGSLVVDTRGRSGLRSVKVRKVGVDPRGSQSSWLPCDLLAVSGGWTPTIHLFSQSGGELEYSDTDAMLVPTRSHQAVTVVGRANGDFIDPPETQAHWLTQYAPADNQWVDLQYDVTAADIQLAARENFVSVEHMKRYTTNGMSVDQGKTSNMNGLGILADALSRPIAEVGTTRFRPPYHPTTLGAFAGVEVGALYSPVRLLPNHADHVAAGAVFEEYGDWKRPAYYPRAAENEELAVAREAVAVRTTVGLLDYSPLGKLEVFGPHAREFLHRVYINNVKTLGSGAARYGLMLNEAGIVIDDGVIVCVADDHFILHTSSGGATTIHDHLEQWLQCEWPDLEVIVSNCTTQWATFMLSGPRSRAVIGRLETDIDLDPKHFSHMQYREGRLCGFPCRLLRASFTGEISFEMSVPARSAAALWHKLQVAGEPEGMSLFGIETLMLLRTEKGYLHVGVDTDGNTMPQDIGWATVIDKKREDFIGRRTLAQKAGTMPGRLQFTGIELLESNARTVSGAHVLDSLGQATDGYVTSAFFSPNLNRTVALGLVANAHERVGERVKIIYQGVTQMGRLVKPGADDVAAGVLNG